MLILLAIVCDSLIVILDLDAVTTTRKSAVIVIYCTHIINSIETQVHENDMDMDQK